MSTKHPWSGRNGADRDFVKKVCDLSHRHDRRQVFDDFLDLSFCALAKTTYPAKHERAEELEARYMDRVRARDADYIRQFPELLALASMALAKDGGDFLGRMAGALELLNEHGGQFFTPDAVSQLMAHMMLGDPRGEIERNGFIALHEPACGAGGMVVAAADALESAGFDPELHLYAECMDIAANAFQMAYVQLSLRGIPATIFHGNALSLEIWAAEVTPAKVRFINANHDRWVKWIEDRRADSPAPAPVAAPQAAPAPLMQLDLFGGGAS